MAVNIANAAAAYAKQAGAGLDTGAAPRSADPAQSFSELLADSVKGAIEAGHNSEAVSAKAIAGKADLNEVVTAVTNAEVTLQAALAIRDRVIQAYQDIVRMPI